jgi:hypothetical protein
MKVRTIIFVAVAAVATVAFGAVAGCSDDVPSSTKTASVVKAKERERIRLLLDGDVTAAGKDLAEDYQLIDPTGDPWTKADYLSAVEAGDLDYVKWVPESPMTVRVHGDAAVVRFRSNLDVELQGEPVPGHFWHMDLYEKRSGSWLLVWSQTTQIGG